MGNAHERKQPYPSRQQYHERSRVWAQSSNPASPSYHPGDLCTWLHLSEPQDLCLRNEYTDQNEIAHAKNLEVCLIRQSSLTSDYGEEHSLNFLLQGQSCIHSYICFHHLLGTHFVPRGELYMRLEIWQGPEGYTEVPQAGVWVTASSSSSLASNSHPNHPRKLWTMPGSESHVADADSLSLGWDTAFARQTGMTIANTP